MRATKKPAARTARKRKALAPRRRGKAKCKHLGRAVAILGVDVEAYACRKCDAVGVRPVGRSNDDSAPDVEMRAAESLAAGSTYHPDICDDVWDMGSGTLGFGDSEYLPETWAWDISRPLAEQLAETAADDAAADALESCPVDRDPAASVATLAAGIVEAGGTLPYRSNAPDASAYPTEPAVRDDYDDLMAELEALDDVELARVEDDIRRMEDDDPPLTVTIDSDGTPAAQINGLCEAPPLFTPDDAEALADGLMLGADAARQAAQDGHHGPAMVVELLIGEEPEHGVELEVEPVTCTAQHDGECQPAAWDDGPMVCVVPLRAEPDCRDEDGPEVERIMAEMERDNG